MGDTFRYPTHFNAIFHRVKGKSDPAFLAKDPIAVGVFSSVTAGPGITLNGVDTKAAAIYSDDGNAALAAGTAYRGSESRLLLTHTQTGNLSLYGGEQHLKVCSDLSAVTGIVAGGWGYLECNGSGKINVGAGLRGMIDVPNGAVIGTIAAGVTVGSNDLSGTHTGQAVGLNIEAPVAGAWDGAFNVCSALAGSANGSGAAVYINVLINGVAARLTAKYVA